MREPAPIDHAGERAITTRERWLQEGVAALSTGGIAAVRTDRLAQRLGLTKGSFHHHFAGALDYQQALLELCRVGNAEAVASARASLAGLEPAAAIQALPTLAGDMLDVPLDAALRGWAVEDQAARRTVEAIDAERLEFLTDLWVRLLGDRPAARTAALVPHLIAVGASVSSGVSPQDLARVYALLATLVPAAAAP